MPRAGQEAKPTWQHVPIAVRRRTEAVLGTRVTRALRSWGGYSPSATFRLALADGRTVFLKATYPLDPDSPVHWNLDQEERVYQELGRWLHPWAPAYYGGFQEAGWHVVLLEDLGPGTVPPWTAATARAAMRSYGDFHHASFGDRFPRWLRRRRLAFGANWPRLQSAPEEMAQLAGLAGPRAPEAAAWLAANSAVLEQVAMKPQGPPFSLLHVDSRSDNVRVYPRAAIPLRLFDWPFACVGAPEVDFVLFAQSVACEGGPSPEQLTEWYTHSQPVRADVLITSVAAVAGFFAVHSWQPDLPALPRLRSIQRRQLRASLAWAARLLDLPEPAWLETVPD
jgi:hypothetical protein